VAISICCPDDIAIITCFPNDFSIIISCPGDIAISIYCLDDIDIIICCPEWHWYIYLLSGWHIIYMRWQFRSFYIFSFKYFFQDYAVVVSIHHLTADGQCLFIIVRLYVAWQRIICSRSMDISLILANTLYLVYQALSANIQNWKFLFIKRYTWWLFNKYLLWYKSSFLWWWTIIIAYAYSAKRQYINMNLLTFPFLACT
jgi:hypothetical protein